jgi:hypothetical protein
VTRTWPTADEVFLDSTEAHGTRNGDGACLRMRYSVDGRRGGSCRREANPAQCEVRDGLKAVDGFNARPPRLITRGSRPRRRAGHGPPGSLRRNTTGTTSARSSWGRGFGAAFGHQSAG